MRLIVRGTGSNNHNNAYIKINDAVLLNRGDFIGFYLLILDRTNMKKVFSAYYDTQTPQGYTSQEVNYQSAVNQPSEPTYFSFDNSWNAAKNMANAILTYNQSYFVIVVSCVAWERYITEQLVKVLANCGASNILEFYNQYSRTFGNDTTITNFSSSKPLPPSFR